MKEPYVESHSVLPPASQQAMRAFLAQAYAALRLIQDVPVDGRNVFSFGGLPEVESTVAEIERFLAKAALS